MAIKLTNSRKKTQLKTTNLKLQQISARAYITIKYNNIIDICVIRRQLHIS